MKFIEKFEKLLKEKNITAYKFSQDTGISESAISRWRKGTNPNLSSVISVSDYFKVPVDYLRYEEEVSSFSICLDHLIYIFDINIDRLANNLNISKDELFLLRTGHNQPSRQLENKIYDLFGIEYGAFHDSSYVTTLINTDNTGETDFGFAIDTGLEIKKLFKNSYSDTRRKIEPLINTEDDLINEFDNIKNYNNTEKSQRKNYRIPVLGRVPAGNPLDSPEYIESYIDITPDLEGIPDLFGMTVFGDSMEPILEDKDIIVVQMTPDVQTGDMCVFRVMSDDVSVKWFKKGNGEIEFVPENKNYQPIRYTAKEVETIPVTIVGKVVEYRRNIRSVRKKF